MEELRSSQLRMYHGCEDEGLGLYVRRSMDEGDLRPISATGESWSQAPKLMQAAAVPCGLVTTNHEGTDGIKGTMRPNQRPKHPSLTDAKVKSCHVPGPDRSLRRAAAVARACVLDTQVPFGAASRADAGVSLHSDPGWRRAPVGKCRFTQKHFDALKRDSRSSVQFHPRAPRNTDDGVAGAKLDL